MQKFLIIFSSKSSPPTILVSGVDLGQITQNFMSLNLFIGKMRIILYVFLCDIGSQMRKRTYVYTRLCVCIQMKML